MVRPLIVALALALAAGGVRAAEFSSLEERMTEAEFRAAGLDKLTPEELATLNEWLRRRGLADARDASASRAGFRSNTFFGTGDSANPIRSEIRGDFSGWAPGKRLVLENGQEWEVIDGSFSIPPVPVARVTIEPGFLGSWLLKVDGYNATARVRRVR
jgi:hypothetical protein